MEFPSSPTQKAECNSLSTSFGGGSVELEDSSTCKFCTKILAVYETPFGNEVTTELGLVSDMLAIDCGHTKMVESLKLKWPRSDFASQTIKICKSKNLTSARLEIHYQTPRIHGIMPGISFGLVSQKDNSEQPGRIRILNPTWIDIELVRGWRTRCMREHGSKCNEHMTDIIEPAQPLWLVDVENGCIVTGDNEGVGRTYITLSYTWGHTKNFRALKSNFKQLQQTQSLYTGSISDEIPKTIRDAMGIVRVLGERFLWIDSLCIIQDDDESLRHELNRMHLIYANSFLSLIAEEGNDAEYGLRGVKGVSVQRLVEQTIIELAGGEKLASETERWQSPWRLHSGYRSRAWTFQEYVFAKRRLVFGNGPLQWHCSCAGWYEDLDSHPLADTDYAKKDTWGQYQWMTMQIPTLQTLSRLVKVFNLKKLTYPEDMPRAFSGIQSFLCKFYQGGLLFGLPEFFFEIALFWLSNIDCKRRQLSEISASNYIRNSVPSWSWMAWEGEVCFPTDCEFESIGSIHGIGFTEPVTEWYTLDSPKAEARRKIASQWHKYRNGVCEDTLGGWKRIEYNLGPPLAQGFAERPKDLRAYTFEHDSETECRVYWYTLPSVSFGRLPGVLIQTQYLFCETSRAFFFASSDRLVDMSGHSKLQVIRDKTDNIVGGLHLNAERDPSNINENSRLRANIPIKPGENVVELVAIAKGWTTHFKKCGLNENKLWWMLRDWAVPDRDDADDENTMKWKQERAAKDDCFFVLWIKWENKVAYRQGTGIVLADMWEKYKQKELVKLVLG